jgi:Zn-dependent peptidase ImmA (M78 family)/transcriptional regulator with XRE-family HTH domain
MASKDKNKNLPFNPNVLIWARERRALTPEEAAKGAGTSAEKLLAWEAGSLSPTIRQARKLAHVYARPLLEFFSPAVPKLQEMQLVPDFRFHRDKPDAKELVALREVQSWAEEQRTNAIDLLDELGERPRPLSRSIYSESSEDAEVASKRIREAVGFNLSQQIDRPSAEHSKLPEKLRSIFEESGILVLKHSKLKDLRTRGMCLYDAVMPIIIFGQEAPSAQAFTLAHEFAHITLKCSAISGQISPPQNTARERSIETWCNKFAAAFLIPKDMIELDLGKPVLTKEFEDHKLQMLAKRFSVSEHVMLIRLVHLGYVNPDFYWKVKRPKFVAAEQEYRAFGIAPYYGVRYQKSLGKFYTGLVLEAWEAGKISSHNAAEYMGIKKLSHLQDIRNNFEA